MTKVLMLGIPVLCILAAATVCLHVELLNTLREHHPEEWRRLGSPTLIRNSSVGNNLAVMRFLLEKQYEALGDEGLDRISRTLRLVALAYIGALVIVASLLLVLLLRRDF
jgi:hypothetical protein